jgi:muconate cycloisomerase
MAPPEHSARGNRALATNGKGLSFMKITSIEAIPCNLLTIRPHKLAMAKITVPIMADEPLETVEDAFAFARLGAVDAFSLKVTKHGGFTNTRKVAAVAESAGISLFGGGMMESGVGTAASAQLFSTLPTLRRVCQLLGPLLLRDNIVVTPTVYRDFQLTVPRAPASA